MNTICTVAQSGDLPFPPGNPTDPAKVTINLSNGGAAAMREEVAKVQILRPPAADQPRFHRLEASLHQLVKATARIVDANARHDRRGLSTALGAADSANKKATAIARKLGLTVCSQGWGPYDKTG